MGVVVVFALVVVVFDERHCWFRSESQNILLYLFRFGYFPRRVMSGTSVDVIWVAVVTRAPFRVETAVHDTRSFTRVVDRMLLHSALQPPCRLLGF